MRVVIVALVLVLAGCDVFIPPASGTFLVRAMAGPFCAVVTDPPDPDCRPRNVGDAPILVLRADGSDEVVIEGRTDGNGRIFLEVPAGTYLVAAGDVEGLLTPQPLELEVAPGGMTETAIHYGTGIRQADGDGHP